jgi:transposase
MNKSNGGKQRKQKDTVIPMNNRYVEHRRKAQKMTTEAGQAKGLQQTLEERGFDVRGMRVKCSLVCPLENDDCCMARLLSKQDDFRLQESLLEQKFKARGHFCVFLPKFHCELNPIEMVWFILFYSHFIY